MKIFTTALVLGLMSTPVLAEEPIIKNMQFNCESNWQAVHYALGEMSIDGNPIIQLDARSEPLIYVLFRLNSGEVVLALHDIANNRTCGLVTSSNFSIEGIQ